MCRNAISTSRFFLKQLHCIYSSIVNKKKTSHNLASSMKSVYTVTITMQNSMAHKSISINTAKLHYIEPQQTGINGSIYPKFEISHTLLFALIVAGPFTDVR